MANEDYLNELKEKHEEISKQVDQAQQQLNGLVVLKTKIEGAIELSLIHI